MKDILGALLILLLAAPAASAQEINAEAFKRDVLAIMEEAKTGFPKSTGEPTEEENYYGMSYATNLSILGQPSGRRLYYTKPQDYKYTAPVSESFWFVQSFDDTSAVGRFGLANAEGILDGIAKEAGWKKVGVKQEKEWRKKYKLVEYRQYTKPMLSIFWYLEGGGMAVRVHSPYRPADVKVANFLGCMVFSRPNFGFLSVVPVYGPAIGDEKKVADAALQKSGLVERSYQYEWMPGVSVKNVQLKWEKQFRVTVMNPYTVE